MNPLLSILRHCHCRSTHHHFAIDAIPLVRTDAGRRLTKILIRYHDDYLRGAKDPDTRFRDFQNHVVHVTDGYWGGAPRVAHQWYERLQKYLRRDQLEYAAHAAGVISHYFSDPMMPLHTQQSDAEKVLHRPIEWSVTKSYGAIMKLWRNDEAEIVFEMSNGPGWLGEAILHGARHANQFYFPLMETYDLPRGKSDPPAGLSLVARQALAELFGLVVTGWARVIERAAADAEAARGEVLPAVSTTVSAILATSRVPARLILRRIQDRHERLAVEALINEFELTGDVRRNLPPEVDIVGRVIKVQAQERAWKKRFSAQPASDPVDAPTPERDPKPDTQRIVATKQEAQRRNLAPRLAVDDPLVDAPSIGPRTAARFAEIEIHTVGQFLDASASDMASELATRWIKPAIVALWQVQAKLMITVPNLSVLATQMIAGVGCQDIQSLAAVDPAVLHQQVSAYAETSAGKRYLRKGTPPTLADVEDWVENARSATEPSRAAA